MRRRDIGRNKRDERFTRPCNLLRGLRGLDCISFSEGKKQGSQLRYFRGLCFHKLPVKNRDTCFNVS